MREAENTLLDQQLFLLDDAQWDAFTAALDAPAKPSAELRKLMSTPAPWN